VNGPENAWYAVSDALAMGAYRAIREHGLRSILIRALTAPGAAPTTIRTSLVETLRASTGHG
jgi:LacI family transcriptional regulator